MNFYFNLNVPILVAKSKNMIFELQELKKLMMKLMVFCSILVKSNLENGGIDCFFFVFSLLKCLFLWNVLDAEPRLRRRNSETFRVQYMDTKAVRSFDFLRFCLKSLFLCSSVFCMWL